MTKRSDIKKLQKIKKKNSASVNARRVTGLPLYLEDTPTEQDYEVFDSSVDARFSSSDYIMPAKKADTAAMSRRAGQKKAAKRSSIGRTGFKTINFSGVFSSLNNAVSSIFGKKRSGNAALDFAINHKRRSKREKRRRMIFVYGGAGFVITSVVLAVLLGIGGASAPAGSLPDSRQAAATDNFATDNNIPAKPQVKAAGAKMPVFMTFTAAFSDDDFDFILPDDTEIIDPDDTDIIDPQPPPTETNTTTEPIKTTVPDPTPAPINVDDLIDYFVVKEGPYYNDFGYSTNHYKYTQEEFNALAAIIYYEARGEGINGMVAVANVVMNRVLCRGTWPNDIISVLSAPNQFSPWRTYVENGVPTSNANWSNAKRAARAVLDKEVWVIPQDVYFFRSAYRYKDLKGQDWGSHTYYAEYKGHFYYRHNYSGRKRNGDVPPALFDRVYKYPQYGCKPAKRVYRIQYMLNKLGYNVKADSYFGITTRDALIEFQKKHKIKADGIAGPETIKKLIREFGVQNYYDRFLK